MIRHAAPEDAKRLLEIYSYYVENTAISFERVSPDIGEFTSRIETISKRYPYLVLELDGRILGYCYANTFKPRASYDRSVEISVYVDRFERGKGYGRALYGELEKELCKIGILNMYACIASPIEESELLTDASERFHARMGFTRVGVFHKCAYKFGRWFNMIWMEKFIGEHK